MNLSIKKIICKFFKYILHTGSMQYIIYLIANTNSE